MHACSFTEVNPQVRCKKGSDMLLADRLSGVPMPRYAPQQVRLGVIKHG